MKHVFIINPTSGTGDSEKVIPWIEDYFENEDDYQIHITEYPGHATKLAGQYSIKDDVCVYAVGGDGTIYEVLNGLKDGVTMASIPNGSGNDFHRVIYKHKYDLKEILINTIEGSNHKIDYGIANNHRFINVCCMGYDSEVVEYVHDHVPNDSWIPRNLAYTYAAIKKLFTFKPLNLTLTYEEDGQEKVFSNHSILGTVMNGQYYGGGFRPTPKADIKDGYFDVLLVDNMKRRRLIPLLPRYAKGDIEDVKEANFFKLKSFTLETDHPMVYTVDGEVYEDNFIAIQMMEQRLSFRMPKGSVYDV